MYNKGYWYFNRHVINYEQQEGHATFESFVCENVMCNYNNRLQIWIYIPGIDFKRQINCSIGFCILSYTHNGINKFYKKCSLTIQGHLLLCFVYYIY